MEMCGKFFGISAVSVAVWRRSATERAIYTSATMIGRGIMLAGSGSRPHLNRFGVTPEESALLFLRSMMMAGKPQKSCMPCRELKSRVLLTLGQIVRRDHQLACRACVVEHVHQQQRSSRLDFYLNQQRYPHSS